MGEELNRAKSVKRQKMSAREAASTMQLVSYIQTADTVDDAVCTILWKAWRGQNMTTCEFMHVYGSLHNAITAEPMHVMRAEALRDTLFRVSAPFVVVHCSASVFESRKRVVLGMANYVDRTLAMYNETTFGDLVGNARASFLSNAATALRCLACMERACGLRLPNDLKLLILARLR